MVGDDRTVLQAVLDCDSERAALLKVSLSVCRVCFHQHGWAQAIIDLGPVLCCPETI